MRIAIAALLLCISCFGQATSPPSHLAGTETDLNVAASPSPITTAGDLSTLPTYVVGAGVETNPSGVMVTLGVRIGQSNLYSWTTMDTPYQQISAAASSGSQIVASIRTGAAYVVAHKGSCFLYFLGDAGFSSGASSTTLAAYSAGGGMLCSSKKAPSLYFGPIVSAIKISASTATPVAKFMLAWSF